MTKNLSIELDCLETQVDLLVILVLFSFLFSFWTLLVKESSGRFSISRLMDPFSFLLCRTYSYYLFTFSDKSISWMESSILNFNHDADQLSDHVKNYCLLFYGRRWSNIVNRTYSMIHLWTRLTTKRKKTKPFSNARTNELQTTEGRNAKWT